MQIWLHLQDKCTVMQTIEVDGPVFTHMKFCGSPSIANSHKHSHRTILAIAGEDFAVIGSDTRLSEGLSIHSRDSPKTYDL